jgi:hypothetical protein
MAAFGETTEETATSGNIPNKSKKRRTLQTLRKTDGQHAVLSTGAKFKRRTPKIVDNDDDPTAHTFRAPGCQDGATGIGFKF